MPLEVDFAGIRTVDEPFLSRDSRSRKGRIEICRQLLLDYQGVGLVISTRFARVSMCAGIYGSCITF